MRKVRNSLHGLFEMCSPQLIEQNSKNNRRRKKNNQRPDIQTERIGDVRPQVLVGKKFIIPFPESTSIFSAIGDAGVIG